MQQVANVSLYDENDESVAYSVPMMFIPQPGWILSCANGLWEVTSQPMIMLGDRSLTWHQDYPVQVDVRVRPAVGVHDPDDSFDGSLARYERARTRYSAAVENYPRARALAAKILADADREQQEADESLREFEDKPGVPKPEFREKM